MQKYTDSENNDPFKKIRRFNDEEVPQVMDKLVSNFIFRKALRYSLNFLPISWSNEQKELFLRELGEVKSSDGLQKHTLTFIDNLLKNTTSDITVTGLDKLDKNKNYIFISNHRDILTDPFIINHSLYTNYFNTPINAFGNNLSFAYLGDFLRSIKSMVVMREKMQKSSPWMTFLKATGAVRFQKTDGELKDEMYKQSKYILQELRDGESVWIAQSAGRTKNGIDRTYNRILLMFALEGRKQRISFGDYFNEFSVVPVSISYEKEPCEVQKAKELYVKDKKGSYKKTPLEDLFNIGAGLKADKGNVRVNFSEPVSGKDLSSLTTKIDEGVIGGYKLSKLNVSAYNLKHDDDLFGLGTEDINNHLQSLDIKPKQLGQYQSHILNIYAGPVESKKEFGLEVRL